MKIASYFLPLFALLILGAGCALSSVESEKQVQVENFREPSEEREDVQRGVEVASLVSALVPEENEGQILDEVALAPRVIQIQSGNFFFDPSVVTAKRGELLTIEFGKTSGEHRFVMEELGIDQVIVEGSSVSLTAPMLPGRYPYYCSHGANRKLGMEGVLIVE